MDLVEQIDVDGQVAAILVRAGFRQPGIHFFTPDSFSQQLAYMRHPAGKIIDPHIHNSVRREVFFTNEVLVLRRGRVRVDFYNQAREHVGSRILEAGDVILLASGGHGFEVLEEAEMIEVKQGPYAADVDKTRFAPSRGPESP
jgi:mannose-6-phosphate isomerase-like protein (cupin superfamily)